MNGNVNGNGAACDRYESKRRSFAREGIGGRTKSQGIVPRGSDLSRQPGEQSGKSLRFDALRHATSAFVLTVFIEIRATRLEWQIRRRRGRVIAFEGMAVDC